MKIIKTIGLAVALSALSPAWAQEVPTAETSLHVAALVGDVDAVQRHIEAGAPLDERDAFGSTPLIIATTFGHTEVARALIAAGADLNVANGDGSTPLHIAAFLGRTDVVRALLDAGANKYLRNNGGSTALDSVSVPFDDVRDVYDDIARGLAPLGLTLDYDRIRAARLQIAALLRPRPEELAAVDYTPSPDGDWPVSTPAQEGLDPTLVAEAYLNAGALDRIYSLLIVKNGRLIAEAYFNGGSADQQALLQSVGKSFTSALVGLALEQGCFSSLDQTMLEFFPEQAGRITDPRKREITLREMLQMRAGFPWEETDPALWDGLVSGDYVPLVADFPLSEDPGTAFQYSNLTSTWLAIIVARACGTDLLTFAREHLFAPLGVEVGDWLREASGYYVGHGMMHFTARDAARFGLLYLQGGAVDDRQVVPAAWVSESLQTYSEPAWPDVGFFRDIGYGYQWWSAEAGDHHVNFAWGHGGQLIVLVDDQDMVIVVTSDPFFPGPRQDQESWRNEVANLALVSALIRSLPTE